jgi:hypothetical protein
MAGQDYLNAVADAYSKWQKDQAAEKAKQDALKKKQQGAPVDQSANQNMEDAMRKSFGQ